MATDDLFDMGLPYRPDPAEEASHARREAFVTAWQAEHPHWPYGPIWTCPLCGYAVQCAADAPKISQRILIEFHQTEHGADWKAYMAIGAQREAASQGEGG